VPDALPLRGTRRGSRNLKLETRNLLRDFAERRLAQLAQTLTRVRANKPTQALPSTKGMTVEQRYALERELVGRSITFARAHLGLSVCPAVLARVTL
jgi:hypothetical protein